MVPNHLLQLLPLPMWWMQWPHTGPIVLAWALMHAALNEIEKNNGTLYDKTVADACLRLFREKGFKLEGIAYNR